MCRIKPPLVSPTCPALHQHGQYPPAHLLLFQSTCVLQGTVMPSCFCMCSAAVLVDMCPAWHRDCQAASACVGLTQSACDLQDINMDELLLAIHSFFMDLGVDEIRRRGAEDDKPLRMVKTVLHELCKLKVCRLAAPLPPTQLWQTSRPLAMVRCT